MKHSKPQFRILSLAVALLFCISIIPSALAVGVAELPESDQEKLLAFWQQEAYDGLTNAEAVYDYHIPDSINHLSSPSYGGGYYTILIREQSAGGGRIGYDFNFAYYIPVSGVNEDGDAWSGVWDVYPDLYGPLDLSGTGLMKLGVWRGEEMTHPLLPGQTHITSVTLDGCDLLRTAKFSGQEYCGIFSALDCPQLSKVELLDGAFRRIDVGTELYEKTVGAAAFGSGSIGMAFDAENGEEITLAAYPENDIFIGWFDDGELVSRELECTVTDGGNYRAVFGGDADGDGVLTVTDAVLALRMAMNLLDGGNSVDVNGSGGADISDAIMILRFAMGII